MQLLSSLRRVLIGFEGKSSPLVTAAIMPRRRKHGGKTFQADGSDPFALQNVVKKIESFAPRELAEPWDNVGLLVAPTTPVPIKRVLLTNDLSEVVLEEAVNDVSPQLIISYHPLIFPSFKSLNSRNWKERIVSTLAERQIGLYCPHTAWDAVEGGVNDWLAGAFGPNATVGPLKHHGGGANLKAVYALFRNAEEADKAIADLNSALSCSVNSVVQRDGKICLKIDIENEYLCLPYIRPALDVHIANQQTVSARENAGVGRMVNLKEKITLQQAVELVKGHLGLQDVAVAVVPEEKYEESLIQDIAICAGSGGSVLKGVQADLYFTGEMSHHEVLDAVHKGMHVILTRHSNSERGFLQIAKEHLKRLMPEIEFVVSSKDKDPLETK
ncbi:hypothetical protein ONE63_000376 [Megalurothrips usitatus]|uniref:NIF3-like protein 1 n=1 Tax=Megalurothrips usitatus TaxID=439358 RepID=A0AAV7Y0Q7_9NEOP|nr:hypothetical protein ONE63_000376 [Megalurothrips usitatus]